MLVRGDLRPAGVLAAAQGLVAVDPRGLIGDGRVDAASFAPHAAGNNTEACERLVAALAADRRPEGRIRAWVQVLACAPLVADLVRGRAEQHAGMSRSYAAQV